MTPLPRTMDIGGISNLVIPTTFAPGTTHVAGRAVDWPLGLRHALMDATALEALDRLVTGPIAGWPDLEAAELAIRALVLHDRVDCLLPGALVTHRSGMGGGITLVAHVTGKEPQTILSVIRDAQFHNRPVFAEWLSVRDGRLLDKNSFWSGREEEMLSPDENTKRRAFEEYENSDYFAGPFIATPAALGAPSYFGRDLSRATETVRLGDPSPSIHKNFFRTIDAAYSDALEKYEFVGLKLKLGLFTQIVLARASLRSEIPSAVFDLRQAFRTPRAKLWDLFDDLQFERDSHRLTAEVHRLQRAAEAVVPAAYRANIDILRVILNAAAGSASLIGAAVPFLDALVRQVLPQRQVNKIDAARLLSGELRRAGPDMMQGQIKEEARRLDLLSKLKV